MTSTYTSNKNIEKPANGDYPDTWNVPVNADWDIIDKALGSSVSKTLSNVDVFLTISEAQNQQIILTGALTANVSVLIPFKSGSAVEAVGGTWVVYNNTTGSYTVSILTEVAGSTGVFVAQGKRALVYSDGTNMNFADDTRLTQGTGITVSGQTISLDIPVTAARGGTGLTSYTTGDILYASGSTAISKLAIGSSGQVLTVSAGGLPSWAAASGGGGSGTVTSVGLSAGTTGLTVAFSTSNPITTTGTFTLGGTLGVPNGGTGATTLTGYVKGSGSGALSAVASISGADVNGNISGSAANVTGTVAIANGGTGATSASTAATALGVGTSSAASFASVTTTGKGTFDSVKVNSSAGFDCIAYSGGIVSFNVTSSSSIFGTASGMDHWAAGTPNFSTSSTYFRLQGGITPQAYGTTAWTNISDARTKKEEAPYVKGLSDLKTLNVVSYKYNGLYGTPDNNVRYYGLIAQEVLTSNFSDMVGTYVYTDPQTKQQTQLYDVDTSQLVFALINAVEELSNRVAALEAK